MSQSLSFNTNIHGNQAVQNIKYGTHAHDEKFCCRRRSAKYIEVADLLCDRILFLLVTLIIATYDSARGITLRDQNGWIEIILSFARSLCQCHS